MGELGSPFILSYIHVFEWFERLKTIKVMEEKKKLTLLEWVIKNDTGKRGPNGEMGLKIGDWMDEEDITSEGVFEVCNVFKSKN